MVAKTTTHLLAANFSGQFWTLNEEGDSVRLTTNFRGR